MVFASSHSSSKAVTQFEAWSREENSFRTSAIKADRERKQIEEKLRTLRTQQKQLATETRSANDIAGRVTCEVTLLQQEKQRLQKQLQTERNILEESISEYEDIITNETSHKKKYCKEMEELNNELSDLLIQQEDIRLQKLLHNKESIELVRNEINNDHNTIQPIGTNHLDESIQSWEKVYIDYKNAEKERNDNEIKIKQLRAQTLNKHGDENNNPNNGQQLLTEETLQNLERVWEEQYDDDGNEGHDNDSNNNKSKAVDPVHLQLFYGQQQQQQQLDLSSQEDTA